MFEFNHKNATMLNLFKRFANLCSPIWLNKLIYAGMQYTIYIQKKKNLVLIHLHFLPQFDLVNNPTQFPFDPSQLTLN